jgi:hypothetical protein
MNDDIEAIKHDIAATRARLDASVEALVYRANVPQRAKDAVDEKIGSVKSALRGAFGRARRPGTETAVKSMATSVSRSLASMRETLGEPLQRVNDVLPAPSMSKGQSEFMQSFFERNPLGFALTSIAVGLLIGFVLPVSDVERDTVGPLGQQLIDDATSAAGDVIEHGKAVVATIVSGS